MRASTVLIISLIVQVLCWIIVGGLRATMNITVPQYLFGFQISHDVSMGLCLLVLAGIPLSAITAIVACLLVAKRWIGRDAAK